MLALVSVSILSKYLNIHLINLIKYLLHKILIKYSSKKSIS